MLRKRYRSYVKYPISQYICTNNISSIHQNFNVVIDAIEIPDSI